MKHVRYLAACVVFAAANFATAKLPPLTPEQVQAAETKKEQEKINAEKQKILLDQAQDRVVQHYKQTHPGAVTGTRGATTSSQDIPKKAVVPAGQAGPQGGREQSAEAHSAPAK